MNLNDLTPNPGSTKRKRRIARGIGSGKGKTATRGTKGQKARRQIPNWFEGGQTPIHRRLPVKKGFRNINHKEYAIVNLDDLEKFFKAGETVTPQLVVERGVMSDLKDGLKVLAFGTLSHKLTVQAHKFSKTAQAAIEIAGGEVVTL
ncbi:MAG: 50S ribosomal protein L15 [Armatimonadetes bacterium]|nr:50S ribosomal protein L15 [Armatimonadota bacterium]MBX3108425.1 50S ribosomal protein L15 [Fimbriimonadaceae bacterium]